MKLDSILLIDDDFISAYLLNETLTSLDVAENIVIKQDAIQALKFLQTNKVNLIFVDLQMPLMDGFEFLEKFSSQFVFNNIRIIALTSFLRDRDKVRLNALGVYEYIEKPLTNENIRMVFGITDLPIE